MKVNRFVPKTIPVFIFEEILQIFELNYGLYLQICLKETKAKLILLLFKENI